MKKHLTKTTAAALSALLLTSAAAGMTQPASAAEPSSEISLAETAARYGVPVSVSLDGRRILNGEAQIIGSTTYVPLRAFCDAIGWCRISWDASTRTATVSTGTLTIDAKQNALYITANGRYF